MAEEARQRDSHFRLLVEGVHDYAIFMLDPRGVVATWNFGAERLKGYRADEIVGQHFSRFYSPEERERGKPAMELQVAMAEGRCKDEGWRYRKDGTRFWAEVAITAIRDGSGALAGFAKITRDVTERKRAEDNMTRQARLLDVTHDAIMVRGMDGTDLLLEPGGRVALRLVAPGGVRADFPCPPQYGVPEAPGGSPGRSHPRGTMGRGAGPHPTRRQSDRRGQPLGLAARRAGSARVGPGDHQRHHRA